MCIQRLVERSWFIRSEGWLGTSPWAAGHQEGQAGTPEHKPAAFHRKRGFREASHQLLQPFNRLDRPGQTIWDSHPYLESLIIDCHRIYKMPSFSNAQVSFWITGSYSLAMVTHKADCDSVSLLTPFPNTHNTRSCFCLTWLYLGLNYFAQD